MDRFLYDSDLRHKRVNFKSLRAFLCLFFNSPKNIPFSIIRENKVKYFLEIKDRQFQLKYFWLKSSNVQAKIQHKFNTVINIKYKCKIFFLDVITFNEHRP